MAKRAKKPKAPKPPQEWRLMPEIDPLVEELVRKHHKHLERAKIVVLGKPKAGKRMGREVIATVSRPTPATKTLMADTLGEIHYLIVLGLDAWGSKDQKQKRRILDYALCHFVGLDEKDRWAMVGPDAEMFVGHFKRWGPSTAHEEMLVEAIKQMELFPEA